MERHRAVAAGRYREQLALAVEADVVDGGEPVLGGAADDGVQPSSPGSDCAYRPGSSASRTAGAPATQPVAASRDEHKRAQVDDQVDVMNHLFGVPGRSGGAR